MKQSKSQQMKEKEKLRVFILQREPNQTIIALSNRRHTPLFSDDIRLRTTLSMNFMRIVVVCGVSLHIVCIET